MDTEGSIPTEWLADFEAAARRPLALRIRYAFIHTLRGWGKLKKLGAAVDAAFTPEIDKEVARRLEGRS